jgi:hypothetical protein
MTLRDSETQNPGLAKPATAPPPEHSAPGGPVYQTGLKPRQGKVHKLPCGCTSDDTRHLTFCSAVHAAYSAHRSALFAARDTLPTTKEPPREHP